jgi:serine/threonine protein kinase/tetratricopeptide (TPR) repeat protein
LLEARAESIFLDALECEPAGLAGFLDSACGADTELRARVVRLLEAHRRLGTIDVTRARVTVPLYGVALAEGPGATIGPYRLLEEIGEGGFGVVYLAEQSQPVRRKVALKVIKPGMDTRQFVARFDVERQALALMDHPNIARVFDAGATATGRPYLVMELVRGVPITTFCDRNTLTVRQRIELVITVCQAVQHAHQKGVIHRDLKPSNVLVTLHDDQPAVKVIDFGIAKALGQPLTDMTLFTGFAQMIGTPPYMSPEQAQMEGLDVDTRTDIYALGALLYELLTGTTPLDRERLQTLDVDEVRRIIREEEPPRPSIRLSPSLASTVAASDRRGTDPRRLSQSVRGELDWIVMKCLEKDRNRRYETANDLASDLQRYLNNETVQACPPSLAYRLRVFSRRHRASIGTAALLLAIATAGGAMTIWQALRAASLREAAVEARLALAASRQSAAEERASAIARDLEALNKANALIESARSHVDASEWAEAEADLSRALALRPDHSSAWQTRGNVYARLGLWDLAAADFARASRLQEPGSVNSLYLHALLRCYLRDEAGYRAVSERAVKRLEDPARLHAWDKEEIARACLLARTPLLPPDELVMLTRGALDAGRSPARVASLGTALYRAGQYEAGLERLREAKAAGPAWAAIWADSVSAMIDHRLNRPDDARAALRSAADSLARPSRPQPESPGTRWWDELQGRLHYREAARLIAGAEPGEGPWHWCDRGDAFVTLKHDAEAMACFTRAVELDRGFDRALDRRAATAQRVGDWPIMFGDYERLRARRPDDASLNNLLAWWLAICPDRSRRDYPRAIELARKAVAAAPSVGGYWNTLATALYRAGDWDAAVRAALQSMGLSEASEPEDWLLLAACQWRLGRQDRARGLLDHALRRASADKDPSEDLAPLRAEAVALIGRAEGPTNGLPDGRPDHPAAYTLILEIEPGAAWAYAQRGLAHGELREWEQAAADLARALEIQPGNTVWWYARAAAWLGAGDLRQYGLVRTQILKQYQDLKHPPMASRLCYASALAPMEPAEADAWLRMANLAVEGTPGNPRIRAAMNYRAGLFDATIADLEKSVIVYPRRAWDWLFLAMARYHVGQADQAKADLGEAVKWIAQANETDTTGPASRWMRWQERVEVEQLQREAEALIR